MEQELELFDLKNLQKPFTIKEEGRRGQKLPSVSNEDLFGVA